MVTFGRAGEDNKKFKLGDVEQTLAGFAGADYDLQAGPQYFSAFSACACLCVCSALSGWTFLGKARAWKGELLGPVACTCIEKLLTCRARA